MLPARQTSEHALRLLGVARLPLADLIDGSLVKIPLTGEIGLAREEEVTAELTSEGGGIGGGKIVARLRFVPFNPRADEVVGEGLRRAARIMERKGERDGSDSMKLAAKAAGAVAGPSASSGLPSFPGGDGRGDAAGEDVEASASAFGDFVAGLS